MSSLEKRKNNGISSCDFISEHINMSKGCGGIMRAAPCAFSELPDSDEALKRIAMLAAQSSAVTHGHPLGYMSSAMLAVIVACALTRDKETLKEIVLKARSIVNELFSEENYLGELNEAVETAIALSENKKDDTVNLRKLGEGWVAEETLAIAVYCALKYSGDFSAALTASVNHSGDSDSTGAVTGNILGAYLGEEKIDAKWKNNLELYGLISEMADKCAENICPSNDISLKNNAPTEKAGACKKVLFCAGSVMEAHRLCEIASRLPEAIDTVFVSISPEGDTEETLRSYEVVPKYSYKPEYISGADYAADILPLIGEAVSNEKPELLICVSSAECGFAASMIAAHNKISVMAVSAGLRYNTADRETMMRSACDASADYAVAANKAAFDNLLSECGKKTEVLSEDIKAEAIAEKIKEILKR